MFEIRKWRGGSNYCVAETVSGGEWNYLHSNGKIYHCAAEYWPTKEEAQAVLDKFYPKPEHVWEHGDVFRSYKNDDLMMFINTEDFPKGRQVFYLPNKNGSGICGTKMKEYLELGEFLFNIREKI